MGLDSSDASVGGSAGSISELGASYDADGCATDDDVAGTSAGAAPPAGLQVVDRLDSAHYEVRPAGLLERQDSAHEVTPSRSEGEGQTVWLADGFSLVPRQAQGAGRSSALYRGNASVNMLVLQMCVHTVACGDSATAGCRPVVCSMVSAHSMVFNFASPEQDSSRSRLAWRPAAASRT
jgi:hypothetical protein